MRHVLLWLGVALLVGCSHTPWVYQGRVDIPNQVELTDVAFFPQEDYQCGPAALATVLTQRQINTTPEALVDQVYLPQRKGSLQVEMIAAVRNHELLAYPLKTNLDALLIEVAAGNPVLVLQNRGLDAWPMWHFAVVVGYDLERQELILRSGTTKREVTGFRLFERGWAKSQRWAVVVTPPTQLPATAELGLWLQAANDLEQTGKVSAATQAYQQAEQHWPAQGLASFALANSYYAQGKMQHAGEAFSRSVTRDPQLAAGWYNWGHWLAEQGCRSEATQALNCARSLAPTDVRFSSQPDFLATNKPQHCSPTPKCPLLESN